jgi:hypothetical protein
MHFSATSAEKSISFTVEHQCPQCGAPITLGEEVLFFVCDFCRVQLCIAQKGFARYFFSPSPDIPTDNDIIYLPYWRFKGVRYTCCTSGVEHRFLDLSALAMEQGPPQIPFSLGFRSQALSLKLISNKTQGKFIRPVPFKKMLQGLATPGQALKKNQPPFFQEDIGETASLIYSPFYIEENRLYDGILNTPLQTILPDDLDMTAPNLCRPERETVFVSGICPDCGWNLEGHFNSLVLVCKNCHTLWQTRGSKLGKIKYASEPPRQPDDVMIPFWKIKVDLPPIPIQTYADLVRMGNLPKAIQPEWENQPLYFWTPAFKLQPKIFLRLSTQLAIAQPDPPLEKTLRKNIHLPITLPSAEAVQSIKITLASLVRPLKDHLPDISSATAVPRELGLVFLSFEPRHHEYVHPNLNIAINKNILTLSNNL